MIADSDVKDFPVMGYPFEGIDQLCYASLINTDSAPHKNITIEGAGTIDANGVELFKAEMSENKGKRGRAVCIRNTENLVIKGVTIRQSPAWCLHLLYCRDVLPHINRSTEHGDTEWFRGAIYADGFYGKVKFDADKKAEVNEGTPVVDGVYMKNITVDTIAGNAIYLCGLPEMPYKNFYLENITAYGKHGMKTKNMENLSMVNVKVTCDEDI